MRRTATATACALGAILMSLLGAASALADSEPPPPETTSHTGTLVVVGCIVIAVVLASVIVMRRIARSRRDKQIYEEYAERREATGAGAAESDPLAPEENE